MGWSAPAVYPVTGEWQNSYLNDLETALASAFGDLDGANFYDNAIYMQGPLDLGGNRLFGFKKLWGGSSGSSDAVLDATAFGLSTSASAANNKAYLQAAIDALPETGGVVMIPPGEYDIDSGTVLHGSSGTARQNVTIQGAGPSTVLAYSGAGSGSYLLCSGDGTANYSGYRVVDLGIDMGFVASKYAIVFIRTNDGVVHGCRVGNVGAGGIGVLTVTYGAAGTGLLVQGCDFYSCAGNGVRIASSSSIRSEDNRIVGNSFRNSTDSAVWVTDMRGCIVSGNTFFRCPNDLPTGSEEAWDAAILVDSYSTYAQHPVVVTGNVIEQTSHHGIMVRHDGSVAAHMRSVLISGNVINGCTDRGGENYGIAFYRDDCSTYGVGYLRGSIISSNVIMDMAGRGMAFQGHVDASATGATDSANCISIRGNAIIRAEKTGLYIASPASGPGGLGDRQGNATVFANVVYDDGGDSDASMTYGIVVDAFGANPTWCIDNIVLGNVVDGATSASVYDDATDTEIAHNAGY